MNGTENRTVLLPAAESQETLTAFASEAQNPEPRSDAAFARNVHSAQSRQREASHREETHFVPGTNALLTLAAPLFRHLDRLLHTYDVGELGSVHSLLTQEINTFTQNAERQQLEHSQVLVARYLLCTFLDEMISTTYWGKENNWAQDSLLSYFYHETYGGEKFFQLLDKLLASPANHVDLLEFMYVCIALGFEGKYRIHAQGKMQLDAVRDNLYKQIRTVQGRQGRKFYVPQAPSRQRHRLFYKASYPVLIATVLVMLTIVYSVLTVSLNGHETRFGQFVQKEINVLKNAGEALQPLYAAAEPGAAAPETEKGTE
jgi:type VI secretion system protein ImpK